ncbi:Uncharacterised protein [Cedecea neteri]|uniref:Uncharacterized protein n=1 Tax=Cedecea neteri TaxID=158822 RepID=A0A2X3KZQ6_9ENTR|nr:Uncharacterised protein [Cedecea neteri]
MARRHVKAEQHADKQENCAHHDPASWLYFSHSGFNSCCQTAIVEIARMAIANDPFAVDQEKFPARRTRRDPAPACRYRQKGLSMYGFPRSRSQLIALWRSSL